MDETTPEQPISDTQFFREVFNASPIGIAVESLEGQPVFVNPALCSMLGFSEEEMRGKHCVDFSPAEDAEKDWALFQQLRAGTIDRYQLEKRYFRRDGSLIWGRLSLSLLNHRPFPLVIAMVEEVTDKKRAEEALRISEERLRLAQQAALMGTFEWNIETGVNTWTQELEALYGLPPGGFGGTQIAFEKLVHPDDRAKVMKLAQASFQTGQPTKGEWRVVWPDGSVHWIAGRWQVFMNEHSQPSRMIGVGVDIDDRKRAEERLLEMNRTLEAQKAVLQSQEELLKTFVKNVPAAVAMLDCDMRYLQVSDRWCADYLSGRVDVLGRSHYEIFPDMPERWKEVHRRGLQGETLRADEDRWDGQDGPHWARWEVRPWKTPEGTVGGILILAEDITSRKQMEEALRDSEQRLRLAVQTGKMYAYEWDVATDKVVRSEEFGSLLGLSEPSCLTRKELLDRVHPDDRAQFIAAVDDLTPHSPTSHISYRVVRTDGAVIWLEKHGRAFFDSQGKMLRMIGMVADVSERKRSEERLREYEKAVEGAEDMIGVIDRQYRFLLANRQYLNMHNLMREQVVGHFITEVLDKEIFETVIKPRLDECFQGNVVRYEWKFSFPTAGERDLLLSYFPIEGVNGVDRAACILHDITDRKQAEQALAGMSRKLVAAQEQERARIGRELHDDINQRLAMMALELEQLKDNPSEVETRVQELRKQLSDISKDVQALSHDLHSSKLEYLGVVAGIKSWCREFGERHAVVISFSSDIRDPLPLEIGLPLFRVLQEAVNNAVKHSGVKRIEVQLSERSGEVHLVITDKGMGFDVETAMKGHGLGLISMRERVRLVNGTIAIRSKSKAGTTIQVRVPLESEHGSRRAAV